MSSGEFCCSSYRSGCLDSPPAALLQVIATQATLGVKEHVTPQFPHGKPDCLLRSTLAEFVTGFLTGFALMSLQEWKQRLPAASGGNLLQKDGLAEGGSS